MLSQVYNPRDMIHEILPVGQLQCNCSVFGDEASGEAMVVDPGDEIGRILAIVAKHKLTVKATWLGTETPDPVDIDVDAKDGDSVVVGATEFHVLHTPGHTQGSISLYAPSEKKLVAGDTLFRDSIGRTDLPGGDSKQIIRSIHEKLMALPDETIVIPGHGENTTIGREKQFNYFLR